MTTPTDQQRPGRVPPEQSRPTRSLGEEAAKLFAALQDEHARSRRADGPAGHADPAYPACPPGPDWTEDGPPLPTEAGAATPGEGTRHTDHPSTCTWCPLCRGVESLRGVDPEAVDRLSVAIADLAHALAELGATLRERVVTPGYEPPMRPHPETSASRSGTTVDIPVTDEDTE